MHILCLFFVLLVSAYARVAIDNDKLPDESTNLIVEDKSANVISNKHSEKTDHSKDDKNIESFITGDIEKIMTQNICNHTINIIDNFINPNDFDCHSDTDTGSALILTPFIEAGLFEEARSSSKVQSDIFLGVESYSGFVTVNKTYNSNLFFWYFPVVGKPVNETPWIIWLQGGPGASSLTGLFDEIGPLTVDTKGNLKKNPHTWNTHHSLLFIDNPIGTGYSFTENKLGYARDRYTYTQHLYSAVAQLLQIYPELRQAPLYLAGESYAGKYVPFLGLELHNRKEHSEINVNLKGLIVGNGYVEPSTIIALPRAFYNFGIIQKEELDTIKPLYESTIKDIAANKSVETKFKWGNLIVVLLLMSHQNHAYNFLKDDLSLGMYGKFLLQKPEVKKAIHVGERKFTFINITTNIELAQDFLSSSKEAYEILLENDYRVLCYCGQLDLMLSCAVTSENFRTWKWNKSETFKKSARYPYKFDKKLAGYYKSGGGFTEAVIRGAGHMAAADVPDVTQALVSNWTHQIPLHKDPIMVNIRDYIKNNSFVYLN